MRPTHFAVAFALLSSTQFAWAHDDGDHCQLTIELTDADTGQSAPGVVSLHDAAGRRLFLKGPVARGAGVDERLAIHDWFVLVKPTKVEVPQARLTLKAFSGLETELAQTTLDLRGKRTAVIKVPLKRFYDAHRRGLQSANTHVHLRKLSLPESDRYLLEVARADGLDLVYVSYLERAVDDLEYTSNKYTLDNLSRLSHSELGHRHVYFDNGEEHRHNFSPYEEGYGHVMFLHIPELVRPVSIGAGIMKQGVDSPPLRRGVEAAAAMGGRIIWCHNQWGLEDIPNWLMGRLHANNIFDGGTHGSYRHSFYRYLNAGLKVPFSTGTDWFIYDFSRVYVPAAKKLSSQGWLDQLAAGRSYITNGPLLEFSVDGKNIGDTLALPRPGKVKVVGQALGRVDFKRIELIQNGAVIHSEPSRPEAKHFVARLELDLDLADACWLALRTPAPSAPKLPEFQQPTPHNEYDRELFSHTSAIYVTLSGRSVFQPSAAKDLLAEMQRSRTFIQGRGAFANKTQRAQVLGVYDEAIDALRKRIGNATPDAK